MNRVRRICMAVLLAAAVGDHRRGRASAAPAAQLKIAFVGADLPDPFYLTMKCGAFAAAKKYNVDLSWQGTDGVDFAPELAIYNATVQKKPDGIIVAPFSATAFVKPVADTMKAGIAGRHRRRLAVEEGRAAEHPHRQPEGGRSRRRPAWQGARRQGARSPIISFSPDIPVQRDRVNGFNGVVEEEATRT